MKKCFCQNIFVTAPAEFVTAPAEFVTAPAEFVTAPAEFVTDEFFNILKKIYFSAYPQNEH